MRNGSLESNGGMERNCWRKDASQVGSNMMAEVMNKAMQHPISTASYDGSLDCENGKMLGTCDKLVTQQTKSENYKI